MVVAVVLLALERPCAGQGLLHLRWLARGLPPFAPDPATQHNAVHAGHQGAALSPNSRNSTWRVVQRGSASCLPDRMGFRATDSSLRTQCDSIEDSMIVRRHPHPLATRAPCHREASRLPCLPWGPAGTMDALALTSRLGKRPVSSLDHSTVPSPRVTSKAFILHTQASAEQAQGKWEEGPNRASNVLTPAQRTPRETSKGDAVAKGCADAGRSVTQADGHKHHQAVSQTLAASGSRLPPRPQERRPPGCGRPHGTAGSTLI